MSQTVQRRARFVVNGYSPDQMQNIAGPWLDTAIRPRIQAGMDVYDNAAPALSTQYARRKQRAGKKPIRDWTGMSGVTMEAMQVLSVTANKAVIGFNGALANLRASWNNRRWRQFGASPADKTKLAGIIQGQPSPVQAKQIAA